MGHATTGIIGQRAETAALKYLQARGLTLVRRNFRRRGGEIDLIMLEDDCLTFVEVRYRKSRSFSPPAHTVDRKKQRKIIRTAALFVAGNRRFSMHTLRFDVVAIEGADEPDIQWISDAFRPIDSTL